MERIRTSVIIPAFNEGKRLPECVSALKAQTQPFDEIIVVDNNSRDETAEVARSLGCMVVWEGAQGLSKARNAGAHASRGDIICFIDADGQMCPNWLEEALKSLKDPRISAVSGLNIFQHDNSFKEVWYNLYTLLAYSCVVLDDRIFSQTFLVGNNLAIKKDVFLSLGGFEPVIGEDYWISQKFWVRPELKGVVNLKMINQLSSRRFDERGYTRTVLGWLIDTARKTPQVKYAKLSSQGSQQA
ncbi:MAG: glycosyltransferase [Microgenomates group bacterium Gr01-1014_5]|nr:MAG: glycosyltransferase [Microgenomates group bacterium Gr01-1014_5]